MPPEETQTETPNPNPPETPAAEELKKAGKKGGLLERLATLLREDQAAQKTPPTLLYTPEGALSMAERIMALIKEVKDSKK